MSRVRVYNSKHNSKTCGQIPMTFSEYMLQGRTIHGINVRVMQMLVLMLNYGLITHHHITVFAVASPLFIY